MVRSIPLHTIFLFIFVIYAESCLITNCPRGGKRSGTFSRVESNIKACVSCGPEHTGQCFGPNICCGPFGCIIGGTETAICRRKGMFYEREPCMAGFSFCRKGRCAAENLCCTQDSCHTDTECSIGGKTGPIFKNDLEMELDTLINENPQELLI